MARSTARVALCHGSAAEPTDINRSHHSRGCSTHENIGRRSLNIAMGQKSTVNEILVFEKV